MILNLFEYYQHTCFKPITFQSIKKITNSKLRDTVHRFYQDILDFQNAMRFHCMQVNII